MPAPKDFPMIGALPSRPSELLGIAMADYQKVKLLPDVYEINMGTWCDPVRGKCHVCLAGAIMVTRMGCSVTKIHLPCYFAEQRAYLAIDKFRRGLFSLAFSDLGLEYPPELARILAPLSDAIDKTKLGGGSKENRHFWESLMYIVVEYLAQEGY